MGVSSDLQEFVASDLSCVTCGYNLRTLSVSGECPECGTQVRETFDLEQLRLLDDWIINSERYARQMANSFMIGYLATVGVVFVGYLSYGYQLACLGACICPVFVFAYWIAGALCLPNGMTIHTVHPFWIWSMRFMPLVAIGCLMVFPIVLNRSNTQSVGFFLVFLGSAVWFASIPRVVHGFGLLAEDKEVCSLGTVCFWFFCAVVVLVGCVVTLGRRYLGRGSDEREFLYIMSVIVSMVYGIFHATLLYRWSSSISENRDLIRSNHLIGPSHRDVVRGDDVEPF
jgi:hypothetical protein